MIGEIGDNEGAVEVLDRLGVDSMVVGDSDGSDSEVLGEDALFRMCFWPEKRGIEWFFPKEVNGSGFMFGRCCGVKWNNERRNNVST